MVVGQGLNATEKKNVRYNTTQRVPKLYFIGNIYELLSNTLSILEGSKLVLREKDSVSIDEGGPSVRCRRLCTDESFTIKSVLVLVCDKHVASR